MYHVCLRRIFVKPYKTVYPNACPEPMKQNQEYGTAWCNKHWNYSEALL